MTRGRVRNIGWNTLMARPDDSESGTKVREGLAGGLSG
jgi:hypothetical protein